MSDISALLFSLDGTVMYTVQNIVECFNEHYKISSISQRDLFRPPSICSKRKDLKQICPSMSKLDVDNRSSSVPSASVIT